MKKQYNMRDTNNEKIKIQNDSNNKPEEFAE